MSYTVVDKRQAAIIPQTRRSVRVLDPEGKLVGFIAPAPPAEEVARMMARIEEGPGGPLLTTEQVLEHLRSLERS